MPSDITTNTGCESSGSSQPPARVLRPSAIILIEDPVRRHIFPSDIKNLVEKIVLSTYTGPYTHMYASREIMTLMEGATLSLTNRNLFVIRNMVKCLPRGWTSRDRVARHLQSALVPLFEEINAGIVFRWTSVSDDEKIITTRPDASMNIARSASFG
ncbi:hypothetical protein [Parasitella parasitica]|uniref:Uncharacterized protein n=1 Tax=Parasitella parasitica TaxID=35722 RepID=A0A0B7NB22_9FUNG|nr:hypothetical protein [Parasitella parasitica]